MDMNNNKEFTVIEATTKEQNEKANRTIKAGVITTALGGLITAAGICGCININDSRAIPTRGLLVVLPGMVSTVGIGMRAIAVGILEKLKVDNENAYNSVDKFLNYFKEDQKDKESGGKSKWL